MAKILITGGSGLLGRAISEILVKQGHEVAWLSRQAGNSGGIRRYKWSVSQGYIDPEAFRNTRYLVHLAGAGIIDHRWTPAYKKQVIDSRVKSSGLVFEYVSKTKTQLDKFVGGSATGFYGTRQKAGGYSEEDGPGNDFLSDVCVQWENSYQKFISAGIPTTIIRTGIVLAKQSGAYAKLAPVFKIGFGSPMGNGRQPFPWIHIDDIAGIFIHALFNDTVSGVYNGAAPEHIDNRTFSQALAKSLHRPFFAPPVPAFVLKLALGERATTIIEGAHINAEKIIGSGYRFKFTHIGDALADLAFRKRDYI